jgi:hypothetical protein
MASGTGYGVASVGPTGESDLTTGSDGTECVPLTGTLDCTEMRVDAYRLAADDPVDLPPDREQVAVSPGPTGSPVLGGTALSPQGIGRVPPEYPCSLTSDRPVAVVVVSVAPADDPDPAAVDVTAGPETVDLTAVEYRVPSTSDVATARLTAPLGCSGVKVNARLLEPGQAVPTHTEGSQEELFVPQTGPAAMVVADETVRTPPDTVVRVAPETPRSAFNDGDADARWVMFGAPPTGGPEEWDPGAEILD